MRGLAHRIVEARSFEYLLIVLIIGSAVALGMATSDDLYDRYAVWMGLFVLLALVVLVLEVLLKMLALSPRAYRYFMDGWNVFDFLAISFLIISLAVFPAISYYGILIILVRLLRLLHGLSAVHELRMILSTLFRSVPSVGHIVVLLTIILYVYALVGHRSFGEHDPEHWGDLGVSASSLFQIVTLDDWAKFMSIAAEVHPLAWVYFVSFIIISAFVIINVFIAIIIENLGEDKKERLRAFEAPASKEEVLRELRSTQEALRRMEERLQRSSD